MNMCPLSVLGVLGVSVLGVLGVSVLGVSVLVVSVLVVSVLGMSVIGVKHLTQSVDTCHVLFMLKQVHLPVLGSNLPVLGSSLPVLGTILQVFFSVDLEFPRFASYQVGRSGWCQFFSSNLNLSNLNLSNPILSVY